MLEYEEWAAQDPGLKRLIESINASGERPSVPAYLDKTRRE